MPVDPTLAEILGGVDFDPDALREKYRRERDKRLRPEGDTQYVHVTAEFSNYVEDRYVDPGLTREPLFDEVEVIIDLLTRARFEVALLRLLDVNGKTVPLLVALLRQDRMTLAREIGLDVPEIRLVDLDEIDGLPRELPALRADEPRLAYAIRRFDRAPGVRIHAEDFNQIADVAPEKKYDAKPSHWLAQVTQALCPFDEVEELVRRLVFGVCIGNNDMHLKNWGVVYPNGRDARLAPMYDYVCTRAYYPAGTLALTIGEERAFESIDAAALSRFARRAELSERRTLILAAEVVERLRYAWRDLRPTVDNPALVDALERTFAAVPLMRAS
ncbi:MAG: hypothetical protein NVS3B7_14430 [Candidatus Elarobacter sp.]